MSFSSRSFQEIQVVFFSLDWIQVVHVGKSCFGKVCVHIANVGLCQQICLSLSISSYSDVFLQKSNSIFQNYRIIQVGEQLQWTSPTACSEQGQLCHTSFPGLCTTGFCKPPRAVAAQALNIQFHCLTFFGVKKAFPFIASELLIPTYAHCPLFSHHAQL